MAGWLVGWFSGLLATYISNQSRILEKRWKPATETLHGKDVTTGMSYPLGATVAAGGANFSLFSRSATRVELLFFDREDDSRPSRIIELDPRTQRTYHYWEADCRMVSAQVANKVGFFTHIVDLDTNQRPQ